MAPNCCCSVSVVLPEQLHCCCAGCLLVRLPGTTAAFPVSLPHLQAVEAAAIIDFQEGKRASACLAACLHPATNPERSAHLQDWYSSRQVLTTQWCWQQLQLQAWQR